MHVMIRYVDHVSVWTVTEPYGGVDPGGAWPLTARESRAWEPSGWSETPPPEPGREGEHGGVSLGMYRRVGREFEACLACEGLRLSEVYQLASLASYLPQEDQDEVAVPGFEELMRAMCDQEGMLSVQVDGVTVWDVEVDGI